MKNAFGIVLSFVTVIFGASVFAGTIPNHVPFVNASGHHQGDNAPPGNGSITTAINGQGLTVAGTTPATWTHSTIWPDDWQGFHVNGVNAGSSWMTLDFGAPQTCLDTMYIWNVNENNGQNRGMQTVDLYYSTLPTTAPPPAGGTGMTYNFASGGWTFFQRVTIPQANGSGAVDLAVDVSGVAEARYFGFDVINNWGGTRTGLSEVQVSGKAADPLAVIDSPGFIDNGCDGDPRPLEAGPTGVFRFDDPTDPTGNEVGGTAGTLLGPAVIMPNGGRSGMPGDGALDLGGFNNAARLFIGDDSWAGDSAANNAITFSYWQKSPNHLSQDHSFWAHDTAGQRTATHATWSNNQIYWDTSGCCNAPNRINTTVPPTFVDNEWLHLVFVKDGNNKAVYLNGNLILSGTGTDPLDPFVSLSIGSDNNGGRSYDGMIDDFVIFDEALTQAEARALYAGASPSSIHHDPTYGGTEPFVVAGCVVSTQLVSNVSVTNNCDITVSRTWRVEDCAGDTVDVDETYTYQVDAQSVANAMLADLDLGCITSANQIPPPDFIAAGTMPSCGALSVNYIDTRPLTTGISYLKSIQSDPALTGFWQFNEAAGSTSVADSSGNGLTLTPNGGVETTLGSATADPNFMSGNTFDGANDYYTTGMTGIQLGLNSSFTAHAWVNPAALGGDYTIFGNPSNGPGSDSLHLVIRGSRIHMGFWGNDLQGGSTLTPGNWYLLTWRFDAATNQQAVFVNGILENQRNAPNGLTGNQIVDIGRGPGPGRWFNGIIDEAAIVGRSMSDVEINALYDVGPDMVVVETCATNVVRRYEVATTCSTQEVLQCVRYTLNSGAPVITNVAPFVDYGCLGDQRTNDVSTPMAFDFGAGDLQGWTVTKGAAFFRTGDGDGITPANGGGGFAQDPAHVPFLIESPKFFFDGSTLNNGTDVLSVTFAGGAGDQNNLGEIFPSPTAFCAATSTSVTGQKGLAFYNVLTGQYDATIFKAGNGGQNTQNFTIAQLTALGVDPTGTYQLHYFENDQGGWGWGQLNTVDLAGGMGCPVDPTYGGMYPFGFDDPDGTNNVSVSLADELITTNDCKVTVSRTWRVEDCCGAFDEATETYQYDLDVQTVSNAMLPDLNLGCIDDLALIPPADFIAAGTTPSCGTLSVTLVRTQAYQVLNQDGLMNVTLIRTVGTNPGNTTANWLNIWNALDGGAGPIGIVAGYNVVNVVDDVESLFDYAGGGGNFGVNFNIGTIATDGPGGGPGPFNPPIFTNNANDYSIRSRVFLEFPVGGTYTIALGSDDGRRIELTPATAGSAPGFAGFSARYGQLNGAFTPGDTVIGFSGGTGQNTSRGVFNVAAGDVLKLDAFYYEGGGGDQGEISIAQGAQTGFNTTLFNLLEDGVFGEVELSSAYVAGEIMDCPQGIERVYEVSTSCNTQEVVQLVTFTLDTAPPMITEVPAFVDFGCDGDLRQAGQLTLDDAEPGPVVFQVNGQAIKGYVEENNGANWLLLGRGREGWAWNNAGVGAPSEVCDDLGTPAAFAPRYYNTADINGILNQSGINLTQAEIRIKRAADNGGTVYQEDRWRSNTQVLWRWDFDNQYNITHEILSSPFGTIGATGGNTRDHQAGGNNDWRRIFTWAWNGHGNQRGFSYGGGVTNGGNTPTDFLWEFANESHAIPYTEVYLRSLDPTQPIVLREDTDPTYGGSAIFTASDADGSILSTNLVQEIRVTNDCDVVVTRTWRVEDCCGGFDEATEIYQYDLPAQEVIDSMLPDLELGCINSVDLIPAPDFIAAGTLASCGDVSVTLVSTSAPSSALAGITDGLALWLDGNDIDGDFQPDTLTVGDSVTAWNDKSGLGRNATVALGNPTYVDASTATGKPAVSFRNSRLITSYNFDNLGPNYTIFAVSRYTGGDSQRVVTSGSRNWLFGHWNNSDDRWFAEGWINQGGNGNTLMHVYSGVIGPDVFRNANGTNPGADFWKDGTLLITNNQGSNDTNYKPGTIALGGSGVFGEDSNSEVAELIIYDRALTDAERLEVEAYLNGKHCLNGAAPASASLTPFDPDCQQAIQRTYEVSSSCETQTVLQVITYSLDTGAPFISETAPLINYGCGPDPRPLGSAEFHDFDLANTDDGQDLDGWIDVLGTSFNAGSVFNNAANFGGRGTGGNTTGGNQDSAHNSLIMRSPTFELAAGASISFQLAGGQGSGVFPFSPASVTAASSGAGATGVALRRVSDDAYLLFGRRASNANGYQTITWNAATLAPYVVDDEIYTLDYYDYHSGGWGFSMIDDVDLSQMIPVLDPTYGGTQPFTVLHPDGGSLTTQLVSEVVSTLDCQTTVTRTWRVEDCCGSFHERDEVYVYTQDPETILGGMLPDLELGCIDGVDQIPPADFSTIGTIAGCGEVSYTFVGREEIDPATLADCQSGFDRVYRATTPCSQLGTDPANWNFATTLDGWTLLNGEVEFNNGARSDESLPPFGGFPEDRHHDNFLMTSPQFLLDGTTLGGGNVMSITLDGGSRYGGQNQGAPSYTSPSDVLNFNGGESAVNGQGGVALYDTSLGSYVYHFFKGGNGGGPQVINATLADLLGAGVNPNSTFELHFYETNEGSWGWSQINAASVAALQVEETTFTQRVTYVINTDAPQIVQLAPFEDFGCDGDMRMIADPLNPDPTYGGAYTVLVEDADMLMNGLIPGYTFLGAFGGSTYYVSDAAVDWNTAYMSSTNIGGHLVTANSAAENTWLTGVIPANVWLGLTDDNAFTTEGNWVWVTGEDFGFNGSGPNFYQNWGDNEPSDSGGNEDAALLFTNGLWNDAPSTGSQRFVVEFEGDDLITTQLVNEVRLTNDCQVTVTRTWRVEDCCAQASEAVETYRFTITPDPLMVNQLADLELGCITSTNNFPPPASLLLNPTSICSTAIDWLGDSFLGDDGFCTSTNQRLYSITDVCGGSVIVTQLITYTIDSAAPLITSVPVFSNYGCVADDPRPVALVDQITAVDDGTIVVTQLVSEIRSVIGYEVEVVRTWRVEDCCGNWHERDSIYRFTPSPTNLTVNPLPDLNLGCLDDVAQVTQPDPDIVTAVVGTRVITNCSFITVETENDSFVWNDQAPGMNANGSQGWVQVGNLAAGTGLKGYIQFDLNGTPFNPLTALSGACLEFTVQDVNANATGFPATFDIYSIPDGDISELWSETTLEWANAPFNDTGTNGDFLPGAVFVDSFVVTNSVTTPSTFSLCGTNLFNLLTANLDGLVTILISGSNVTSSAISISSKENALGGAALRIDSCIETPLVEVPYTVAWSNDTVVSNSADGCVTYLDRVYTVTEECGLSASVTQRISFLENSLAPEITAVEIGVDWGCQDLGWTPPTNLTVSLSVTNATSTNVSDEVFLTNCTAYVQRTFRVENCCGDFDTRVVTHTYTITPNGPGIDALADIDLGCIGSVAAIPQPNTTLVFASGTCAIASINWLGDTAPTTAGCTSSFVRTYVAVGACGQTVSVNQAISYVLDTGDPSIVVPAGTNFACMTPVIPDPWTDVTGTGIVASNYTAVTNIEDCLVTVIRTYSYTDCCGDAASADVVYTWIPPTAPPTLTGAAVRDLGCIPSTGLIPPPNTGDFNGTALCGATIAFVGASATNQNGCSFEFTNTYAITDTCGQTTNFAQTLRYQIDNGDPVFVSVPGGYLGCTDTNGTVALPTPAADIAAMDVVDDCGSLVSFAGGTRVTNGCEVAMTRTYVATDSCGNLEAAQVVYTWTLTPAAPSLSGPTLIDLGCITDEGQIPAASVAAFTAVSDCDASISLLSESASTAVDACISSMTRTYLVTDLCGQTNTLEQTIRWSLDDTAIEITATEAGGPLGCVDGSPVLPPALSNVVVVGNMTSLTVEVTSGTNGCVGTLTRTYTARDCCGAFDRASVTWTWDVVQAPPVITGEAVLELGCIIRLSKIPLDGDLTVSSTCGHTLSTLSEGPITRTGCFDSFDRVYEAVGSCGEVSVFTQTISYLITPAPLVVTPPPRQDFGCVTAPPALPGTNGVTVVGLAVAITFADTVVTNDCDVTLERIWSVEDCCGDTVSATQIFEWRETPSAPSLVGPAAIHLGCIVDVGQIPIPSTGQLSTDAACGATLEYLGSSATGLVNDCVNAFTRSYLVTDGCGQTNLFVQEIRYALDSAPAEITGTESGESFGCLTAEPVLPPALSNVTWNGVSTSLTVEETRTTNDCDVLHTRVYTLVDCCGNEDTAEVEWTWMAPAAPPVLSGPDRIDLGCVTSAGLVPVADASIFTVAAACGDAGTVFVSETAPVVSGCVTEIERLYESVDGCGQTGQFVQVVSWTLIDPVSITSVEPGQSYGCSLVDPSPAADWSQLQVDGIITASNVTEGAAVTSGCMVVRTRTYSVTDCCGNEDEVTVTFDWTVPAAPPALSVDHLELGCIVDSVLVPRPTIEDVTVVAPCGATVAFVSESAPVLLGCLTSVERVYEAVDTCSQTSVVTQVVSWIVSEDIAITAGPTDSLLDCNATDPTGAADWSALTIVGTVVSSNVIEGPVTTNGCAASRSRTYEVENCCGRTARWTVNTTWQVVPAPSALVGPLQIDLGCIPSVGLVPLPNTGLFSADSACGATISYVGETGPVVSGCLETLERTYRAVDGCGQTSEVVQVITYSLASTPPVITSAESGGDYGCQAANPVPAPDWSQLVFTGDVLTSNVTDDVSNIGCRYLLTRTYQLADCCGNADVREVLFEWTQDDQAPTLAANAGVELDSHVGCNPGILNLPPLQPGDFTATDSCGDPAVSHAGDTITTNGCEGLITRVYQAVDACGNTTTITQFIGFTSDTASPTPSVVPATMDLGCNPTAIPDPSGITVMDLCTDPVATNMTESISTNGCEVELVRTFEFTDACGNQGSATQTLRWREDSTPPVIDCPTDIDLGYAPESIPEPAVVLATDNCGAGAAEVVHGGDTTNLLEGCQIEILREYSATDECGNVAVCTQFIFFTQAYDPPTFSGLPAARGAVSSTLSCGEATPGPLSLAGLSGCPASIDPLAVDVSTETLTAGCAGRTGTRYIYTTTDAVGQSSSYTQTFTYTDTEAPVFTSCPEGMSLTATPNSNGVCLVEVPALPHAVNDNCTDVTVTQAPAAGSMHDASQPLVIILMATDACDNSTECRVTYTYQCNVSISGSVWLDLGNDGDPSNDDLGELGLGGIGVTLRDTDGNIVAETTTDPMGGYEFIVPPGMYTLEFDEAALPDFDRMTTSPGAVDATTGNVIAQNLGIAPGPTAVTLETFDALVAGEGVAISWQTAWEEDTLGYRVWRGTAEGPREALDTFVVASGAAARYEITDVGGDNGIATHYYLEVVATDLSSEMEAIAHTALDASPTGPAERVIAAEDGVVSLDVEESTTVFLHGFDTVPRVLDQSTGLQLLGEPVSIDGSNGVYLTVPAGASIRASTD